MKVFVTGATGFVGSAVVKELLVAGHQVTGLVRSEESARKLKALGVEVHRGDLTDVESLKSGANATDAIIHTAFIHDFSRFEEVCAIDKRAIEAMGEVFIGTERPIIVTSGTALVTQEAIVTEDDRPVPGTNPRIPSELAIDELAAKGVRIAAVRLPPSVHGDGDVQGFVPILINIAREKGKAAYIGEGLNRWPAVNRLDAAHIYRLALEKNFVKGTRYHAVDEQGIPFKEIADAIGKKLHLPVTSLEKEDAKSYFTWFTHFVSLHNPTSSEETKKQLNWQPTQASLLEDLESDIYFAAKP